VQVESLALLFLIFLRHRFHQHLQVLMLVLKHWALVGVALLALIIPLQ
jgi:hypothetical protein